MKSNRLCNLIKRYLFIQKFNNYPVLLVQLIKTLESVTKVMDLQQAYERQVYEVLIVKEKII
ncbi:MAG: hypothetical protein RR309_08270 [Cellulosilyticaceae bacterium]